MRIEYTKNNAGYLNNKINFGLSEGCPGVQKGTKTIEKAIQDYVKRNSPRLSDLFETTKPSSLDRAIEDFVNRH